METKIPRAHKPITLPVTVPIFSQDRVRLVGYLSDSCGRLAGNTQQWSQALSGHLASGWKKVQIPSGPFRSTLSWVFQKWSSPSEWDPCLCKHSCELSIYFLNFPFFDLSPLRPPALPILLSTNCILLSFVFILLFAQTQHFHFSLFTFASGEQRKNTHTSCPQCSPLSPLGV